MFLGRELALADLIDVSVLQRVQDSFANMTGMSAIITDTDGMAVTKGSGYTEFCLKYTRASEAGCARCEQCGKRGVQMACEKGGPVAYTCHAGLTDYAVPILADGRATGCFIVGQVFTQTPDPEALRKTAEEIGADPEEYIAAAAKVKTVEKNALDSAADFLCTVADVLAEMAYNKYLAIQTNDEMKYNLQLAARAYDSLDKSESLKADFLANMSHEIRTPMNAVIGMAEMALREELPPAAREYIDQIKEAGRSLLTIINDILDFSKIESGKMDISEVDYEPVSLLYDVAGIVMTRLKDKDVELILDVAPGLPGRLWGDNIRIKQVLLNLANNAAKFTAHGKVVIKMDSYRVTPGDISLQISVEDTGTGIREEDMDRLFQSFQQVDSRKNRNIEGTGLGLAISRNLLTLMDGTIWVESEYGKGSKFSCSVPQKIVDDTPSIAVADPASVTVACMILNPYVQESLCNDVSRLGVEDVRLIAAGDIQGLPRDRKVFLFVEEPLFSGVVKEYIRDRKDVTAVLIIGYGGRAQSDLPNLLILKKPVFALNIAMVLNGEKVQRDDAQEDREFDFTAPDAKVLIVDDNEVNLTVAEGLLEPLKMQVDTAAGGREAIERIAGERYDLIFMDHMMPEPDGVETTHIIRRLYPEYADVPVIALTANAMDGTRELFLREGLNDFIAKPIELRVLIDKVRQWLPAQKLQKDCHAESAGTGEQEPENIAVGDLDVRSAMKFLVSGELFWKVLKVFYNGIDKKARLIKSLEERENWTDYTVEVHALKNSARQIGALSLSEKAAALEAAGNAGDAGAVHSLTDEMLAQYTGYKAVLAPFCQDSGENRPKEEIRTDVLRQCFADMREAIDDLDMDRMETVMLRMERYRYPDRQGELFAQLKEAAEEMDVERCEAVAQEWETALQICAEG